MGWLARDPDRRADPRAYWPAARSVIMVAASIAPPPGNEAAAEAGTARIARYARARDYHDTVRTRLKALGRWLAETHGADFKTFVDTAPLMEKPLAQRAGLGWQGRNTTLVSPRHGPWLILGGLLTDRDLPPDPPERDRCGACRACVEACPTGALDGSGRIEPRLCLAYHTIESPDLLPEALRPRIEGRVFGCDACLAACPWGAKAPAAVAGGAWGERPGLDRLRLADLAALDAAGFQALFAGTPVKRAGWERFVARVLVALAPLGGEEARRAIARRRTDSSSLIRAAAAWAALRLGGERPGEL